MSNEVQLLRDLHGGRAPVVSFSSGQRSMVSIGERVIRLSAERWRCCAPSPPRSSRARAVTHVFGALDEWHLLRAVGRRPVVFTVALPGRAIDPAMSRKVTAFAAETEPLAEALVRGGVPASQVSVVYPGVDLSYFSRNLRLRPIAFASSLRVVQPTRLNSPARHPVSRRARARRPDVDIVLLWRSWGDRRAATAAFAALSPPSNVIIESRAGRSMPEAYRSAHATICCYEEGFGKSCPNSIVESAACGRPVIVNTTSGVASLVERTGAGVVVPRTVGAAAEAVDRLRDDYASYAARARALAVDTFDVDTFRARYCELYARLAGAA